MKKTNNDNINCILNRISIKFYLVLLLVIQFMWYVIMFPGCISYDSYNQIAQAVGWIPFMDNNPIFHSMLMAVVMRPIYLLTNNIYICIAAWNFVSNLYYFFVILYCLKVVKFYFDRYILAKVLFLFYAICPLVWGFWSVLWKDVWISYSVLLLFVSLVDLIYITKYDKFVSDRCRMCVFSFSLIMTLISKGTGILFVIPLLSVLVILYKRINIVIIVTSVSLLVYYILLFIVTRVIGFQEHGNMDFLCMAWQILGGIVKDNDLSLQESLSLGVFVDIKKAKYIYNPYIADPIKAAIDIDKFNENILGNSLLIVKLATRYYKSSLKSIIYMISGYVSPLFHSSCICTSSYNCTVYNYMNSDWKISFDPMAKYITSDNLDMQFRDSISRIYNYFGHLPLIGYLFNIGFYNMVWMLAFIISIMKRYSILLYIIPFMCFISCIASPVSGEFRYAYPMILIIPIIIIWLTCIGGDSNEN